MAIKAYSQLHLAITTEEVKKSPLSKAFMYQITRKNPDNVSPEIVQKVWSVFRQETTVPKIDEAVDNPVYFAEQKNRKVRLLFIPPAEYFVACSLNRGFGSEKTERGEVVEETAQKYADFAIQGSKFPALNLDLTTGDQEGRHRARMAEILKLPYVPVFIYDYFKEPEK